MSDTRDSNRVVIIGGGAAGLSAAYTLKKRGLTPILLEAEDQVGGRIGGELVDGFTLDAGADFFTSSYDVAFRICDELGLSLVRSVMNLACYRRGRWVMWLGSQSIAASISHLVALVKLGVLSPRSFWPSLKIAWDIRRHSEDLNFASGCRMDEYDGQENLGEYLDRQGSPESLKVMFMGFLEMTMGHVEFSGAAYMRAYIGEMLVRSDQLYVPENGTSALARALADACSDVIRVSTPVRRVNIKDGAATGVVIDDSEIDADAVICAVPATKVSGIIPDLPHTVRKSLDNVTYSSGCRVVIGLDRPPLPEGWHAVLYPEDDTPMLLDRSINLPSCAPPGKSTLDLIVGRDRAKELIPMSDEEIKRAVLADARRKAPPGSALPADDEGLFYRVFRWEEAVCMGPPGMFTAVADVRRQIRRDISNLSLAGDYMRVPSVNGALASGVSTAEEVADMLAARSA